MLIERQKRLSRVRFKHPIRVVTLEGQPRVIRTLTANVSRKGLFLRMPEPLPMGTKVALSLEAGGRALALAQAEVVWGRVNQSQLPGRFPGCGVRFTEFMHPRAEELVDYLVHNLDRGKPLMLAPPERRWMRWAPYAAGSALLACAALATLLLWGPSDTEDLSEEAPGLALVAEPPTVRPAPQVSSPSPGAGEGRGEGNPKLSPSSLTPSEVEGPAAAEDLKQPVLVAGAEAPAVATVSQVVVTAKESGPTAEVAKSPVTTAKELAGADDAKQRATESAPTAALQPAVAAAPPSTGKEITPAAERRQSPVVATALERASAKKSAPVPAEAKTPSPRAEARKEPQLAKLERSSSEKEPAKKAVLAKDVQRGNLKLPSGAATSLAWTLAGAELRLSPELSGGAQITHAFVLTGPPRAVFDLSGSAPLKSHVVPASPPYATAVRLGKQGAGTRIVVDLDSAPKRVTQDGAALVLTF